MRLSTRAAFAAAALLLGPPSGAQAHGHLKSASPADKATLSAAPDAIRLEFSEEIELKFSTATVTGTGKGTVKTGEAMHGKGGDSVLEVPLQSPLAPGAYTVEWRILSKDGHKTKGSTTFSIKP